MLQFLFLNIISDSSNSLLRDLRAKYKQKDGKTEVYL